MNFRIYQYLLGVSALLFFILTTSDVIASKRALDNAPGENDDSRLPKRAKFSTEDSAELANLHKAFSYQENPISNGDIEQIFLQAANNANFPPEDRDRAAFNLAWMHKKKETSDINDDKIEPFLIQAKNSPYLPQKAKDWAGLELAWLQTCVSTQNIEDQEIEDLFLAAWNSQYLNQADRDQAASCLLGSWFESKTTTVKDEDITPMFHAIQNSRSLSQNDKDDAVFQVVEMKFLEDHRATLPDKEAVRIFLNLKDPPSDRWDLDCALQTVLRVVDMHFQLFEEEETIQYGEKIRELLSYTWFFSDGEKLIESTRLMHIFAKRYAKGE